MGYLISIEGICCSGKTTFSELLKDRLLGSGFNPLYNHGAMTYTPIGREFYNLVSGKNTGIITSYYLIDLLVNHKQVISPFLEADKKNVVIQDRYIDSITTYANAYGTYFKEDCDIYRIREVLTDSKLLSKPDAQIFCIPPYDVILERMKNSKDSPVHNFYRRHNDFLKTVYDELLSCSSNDEKSMVVDTSDSEAVRKGIDFVLESVC